MRLTPSQVAMYGLLGKKIPRAFHGEISDIIVQGYNMLTRITGKDFGYNLDGWHKYLSETDEGGYKFENGNSNLEKEISKTKVDKAWLKAIEEIENNEK